MISHLPSAPSCSLEMPFGKTCHSLEPLYTLHHCTCCALFQECPDLSVLHLAELMPTCPPNGQLSSHLLILSGVGGPPWCLYLLGASLCHTKAVGFSTVPSTGL